MNWAKGGTIDIVDNNDGTWRCFSFDPITYFLLGNKSDYTEIVMVLADTIQTLFNPADWEGTFEDCIGLTSFDTSQLTSVINASNAWNYCINMISFDASGLTSAMILSYSWRYCRALTSFDGSGLTSALNIGSAWDDCRVLTSFDFSATNGLSQVTNGYHCFLGCASLLCLNELNTTGWTGYNARLGVFNGCASLVAPDAATQILLAKSPGSDWVNPNPCP